MPCCAVSTCTNCNRKTKGTSIQYFRFPKNEYFAKQWVKACDRVDPINLKYACVCSIHFEEDSLDIPMRQRLLNYKPKNSRNLKPDAVPTLHVPGRPNKPRNEERSRRLAKREQRSLLEELLKESVSIENRGLLREDEEFLSLEVKEEIEISEEKEVEEVEEEPELQIEKPVGDEILRVCRTCLKIMKTEDAVPLFMDENTSGDIRLYDKVKNVLQSDLIPVHNPCLCKPCENFITTAYDFQTTCKMNEQVLSEFDWGPKTMDLLYVVDQDHLKNYYEEVTTPTPGEEVTTPTPDEFWSEANDQGNGLSDMEDHWYEPVEVKKRTEHDYAASPPTMYLKKYAEIPPDADLFSPAFDVYFQRYTYRSPPKKLIKRCKMYHFKDLGHSPFLCDFCGKFFKSRVSFHFHIRKHLKQTIKKNFRCATCSEVSAGWRAYAQHSKLAHGGLPKVFKCHLCSKKYHRKKLLENHLIAHRLQRDSYTCLICQRIFPNLDSFEKHKKRHRQPTATRVACKLCGTKIYKCVLDKHMIIKHSEKSIKRLLRCNLCNRKYLKFSDLKLHKIKSHNCNDDKHIVIKSFGKLLTSKDCEIEGASEKNSCVTEDCFQDDLDS